MGLPQKSVAGLVLEDEGIEEAEEGGALAASEEEEEPPQKKLKNPPEPELGPEEAEAEEVEGLVALLPRSFSFILGGIGMSLSRFLKSTTSFFFLNKPNTIIPIGKLKF
jgi:hypothetical protein